MTELAAKGDSLVGATTPAHGLRGPEADIPACLGDAPAAGGMEVSPSGSGEAEGGRGRRRPSRRRLPTVPLKDPVARPLA